MNNERRKFPRVPVQGEVSLQIAGIVRNADLLDISPWGIQVECRHQLIEHLSGFKSDAGLYPDFELQFKLGGGKSNSVKSLCNIAFSRRLSQDCYHLSLHFISLTDADESKVMNYIDHAVAA